MTFNVNSNTSIYPINTAITTTSANNLSYVPINIGTASNFTPQIFKKTIYTEIQNIQKISSILNIARMKMNACEEKFKMANNIVGNYNMDNKEALDLTDQNLKELKVAAEEILNMTKEMQSLLNNEIMEEVIK